MKLFYHLFGYLLLGMAVLIGVDEYIGLRTEVAEFEKNMIASAVQNGKSLSGILTHAWKDDGERFARALLQDAGEDSPMTVRWIWLDELLDNKMLPAEAALQLNRLENGTATSLIRLDPDNERRLYTYVPVDVGTGRNGALELKQTLVPLKTYTKRMVIRAVLISTLLASICGLVLYLFINKTVRVPLGRLVDRTKRIGQGDLSTDASFSGHYELATMARTLNDLCSSLTIAKEKIKFEYDARIKTLDQLRHTERLSTFGLIAAGIAHEIGTPLNVVDGRAMMIIKESLTGDEIKECATIIKSQAERMTTIIRQLLDFTRRPKQHMAQENILFILKQIFQLLHPMASKQNVTFSLHRDDETTVTIRVDGAQIQQVLMNLLINSVQAMPDGGNVSVTVTNEMVTSAEAHEQQPERHMKIGIVDEGVGICQEDLDSIFTPFFTTKTVGTGTGLGLSIAHGIVEEHGGWIEVESNVRNGACFSVFLPMEKGRE